MVMVYNVVCNGKKTTAQQETNEKKPIKERIILILKNG